MDELIDLISRHGPLTVADILAAKPVLHRASTHTKLLRAVKAGVLCAHKTNRVFWGHSQSWRHRRWVYLYDLAIRSEQCRDRARQLTAEADREHREFLKRVKP